jgi:hypothetical protein
MAQATRISMTTVGQTLPLKTETLPDLNPREREILDHIVASHNLRRDRLRVGTQREDRQW